MAIKISPADYPSKNFNKCSECVVIKHFDINSNSRGAVIYNTYTEEADTIKFDIDKDLPYDEYTPLRKFMKNNSIDDIIPNFIISMIEKFDIKFDKNLLKYILFNPSKDYSHTNPVNIPIKVIGGRKGKGVEGVIVSGHEKLNDFTRSYVEQIVIFDPKASEFITVNSLSYLEIDKDFIEKYNNSIKDYIYYNSDKNKADKDYEDMINLFVYKCQNRSYSDDDIKKICDKFAEYPFKDREKLIDKSFFKQVTDSMDDYIYKKKKEHEKLRKEKLPGILDWVNKNTDKRGADAEKLANHIFDKHNPIRY